jgi:hypothetical protein
MTQVVPRREVVVMGKKMAQRRPWFLWIGGASFLVGSLVAGSVSLAASAGAPTFTANQGSAGNSPWPVTASQGTGPGSGGAWKVDGSGVTQPVSGTVGIDQTTSGANGVTVKNLPSSQTVNGSVGLDPKNNTVKLDPANAAVTSGDVTTVLKDVPFVISAGDSVSTGSLDTTGAKTIRVDIVCSNPSSAATWTVTGDGFPAIPLASGDCSTGSFSGTFDVPGTTTDVTFDNGSAFGQIGEIVVVGRST